MRFAQDDRLKQLRKFLTSTELSGKLGQMSFSTSQAARKLGIGIRTLSRYIAEKKVPTPQIIEAGGNTVHLWTAEEIEHVRKLLPKIANGRKTRYQKLREKGPQAGAPALQKKQPKKK
jgi:transcriptional regulator with XRE-family HTH domain